METTAIETKEHGFVLALPFLSMEKTNLLSLLLLWSNPAASRKQMFSMII